MKPPVSDRPAYVLTLALFFVILSGFPASGSGQSSKQSSRQTSARVPDWYNTMPPDSTHLLARGRGRSTAQQVSIDKAVAAARHALARSVEKRWKTLKRSVEMESGEYYGAEAESVTLTGSIVRQQTATKRGRIWTAYALVAMPEESVRAVLDQRLRRDAEWYEKVKDTEALRGFEALTR